ncbi:TPA: hypothetical protein DEP90_01245 [Patescibacteria group bacterium]|nr:hypothetical protein [Patescibacteria group bacterium]
MPQKINIKILVLVLPFFLLFIFFNSAYAQAPTSFVSISVKLSLCGDGIIEGSEECEGINLNDQTCNSLDFQEGTLSCDPACSFNTHLCIPYPPPETPNGPIVEEEQIDEVIETPTKNQFLEIFDENGDGILTSDEIPSIVITWVNAWTMSEENPICDLNDDLICNLYDFSILLYLIDSVGL